MSSSLGLFWSSSLVLLSPAFVGCGGSLKTGSSSRSLNSESEPSDLAMLLLSGGECKKAGSDFAFAVSLAVLSVGAGATTLSRDSGALAMAAPASIDVDVDSDMVGDHVAIGDGAIEGIIVNFVSLIATAYGVRLKVSVG